MMDEIHKDPAFRALVEDLKTLSQDRQEAFTVMMDEKVTEERETAGFVTPKEFAEKTGFAAGTVRRWLKEGVIRGKQVGKKSWRIPVEELQKTMKV